MNITQRIADKLDSLFPDIPIHVENINYDKDGDLIEPSFFIQRVNMTISPQLFDVQKRIYRYHIVYFPPHEATREDLGTMAEQLAWEVQQIDNVARLFERDLEVLESDPPFLELHFSFALEVHVISTDGERFDNNLDIKGGLK